MKKKKRGFFLFLILSASVISFIIFSTLTIIPDGSIVRNVEEGEITFNKTNSLSFKFKGSENMKVYTAGMNFKLQDYFYARQNKEKYLNNSFSFSVMFPEDHICATDTAFLFNQIRAHAYICMQKASDLINNDFYYGDSSYPKVFEKLLNQDKNDLLKNLYFTDVRISKIAYEKKHNLDDMTFLLLSNINFLNESILYQEIISDELELRELNSSLLQEYLSNQKKY